MAIVNVTDQEFKTEVGEQGTVLVDFWAPWCGPCKMMAPILDELDNETGSEVKILKVNVDENPETAAQYGIMSIPTIVAFKNGEAVDKVVGLKTKDQLKSLISKIN
ncbi:MAG: thioredoxin [Bacilli bacterium]|nr:thioredoxin [Bacilli bacterium]